MKNLSVTLTLLLISLSILSCSSDNDSALKDFLDIKAGDEVKFDYKETHQDDFRSKLPYHYFDVPLPNESILKPVTHFKASINKQTSVLHLKTIELPLTQRKCFKEAERYKDIFRDHGFSEANERQGSVFNSENGLVKQSQVLTISCGSSGSSPFSSLEINVTTIEEHEKFEDIMSDFKG